MFDYKNQFEVKSQTQHNFNNINERHDMNMNTTRHLKSIPFNYNGTTFHIIGNTAQGFTGITWDNGKYESLEVTRRQNDDFLEIVKKALKENEVTQ
jgi:hypothetical protein